MPVAVGVAGVPAVVVPQLPAGGGAPRPAHGRASRAADQAFPSISTGVYGYPIKDAAVVALEQVAAFLLGPDGAAIDQVIFCTFSEHDYKVYEESLSKVF